MKEHNITLFIYNSIFCFFLTGSVEHELVCDIIEDVKRVKDVKQMSPVGQTSSLEAFHSLINHFCPKMFHFHFRSMYTRYILCTSSTRLFDCLCSWLFSMYLDWTRITIDALIFRLRLAALHFNHNADRERSENLAVTHPKFKKGEATIRKEVTPCNYGKTQKRYISAVSIVLVTFC